MAITLGTNAYTTATDFKAWADTRMYDYFAYNDLEIEAAIVIASVDFIDTSYTFKGKAVDDAQAMQLPTDDVAIADIANGVHQAVWQHLQGKLFVPDASLSRDVVESESKTLGDLSKSVTYKNGYRKEYTLSTTKIDRLLAPFVIGSAGGVTAVLRG